MTVNICYANSYTNVDIIGTINLNSATENIELTFKYGKNFDLMIPATPLLLSKIESATPNDELYYDNSRMNRKYHMAFNIIDKDKPISSDNIDILSVYPLSLEEIDEEKVNNIKSIIDVAGPALAKGAK